MSKIQCFKEIKAWQNARMLANATLQITSKEGFNRNRELRNQMQRAAVSIMSNIAEGFERDGRKEFIHFLSIAKASAGELRSQLYLARDLHFICTEDFDELLKMAFETSRIIGGFINYLRSTKIQGTNRFLPET